MHPSMAKLPSAEDASLAFAEVATAVGYLHAQGGMAALRDGHRRVADGVDARKAVAAAAGGGWADFERGWKAYMAGQKLKTVPRASTSRPLTSARPAPSPPAASRARTRRWRRALKRTGPLRFLRLGNMMLKRNRPRAAALEYEKGARAAAPASRRRRRRPRDPARGTEPPPLDFPGEAGSHLPGPRRAGTGAQGAGARCRRCTRSSPGRT